MLRIGHRGAPRIAPANTMLSFQAARERGCDWVECDCRASADGVVVLAHDSTVTDRDGQVLRVAEHTAEALAGLDLGQGEGVPTLQELVAWAAAAGMGVMADVKDNAIEEQIERALRPLPPSHEVVSGADDEGRRRFRSLSPDLPLSLTVSARCEDDLLRRWGSLDTAAVTLEFPLVTHDRVADLRRRGISVYVWTVDDFTLMRALRVMGVDGIISNRADLLAEL